MISHHIRVWCQDINVLAIRKDIVQAVHFGHMHVDLEQLASNIHTLKRELNMLPALVGKLKRVSAFLNQYGTIIPICVRTTKRIQKGLTVPWTTLMELPPANF